MSEKVDQEGDFKVTKKRGRPKKLNKTDEALKVTLDKKEEKDAVQESETEKVVLPTSEESKETGEETKVELQEVGKTHEEEKPAEKTEEQVIEIEEIQQQQEEIKNDNLPDSVSKLVDFMKDTGGTLEDYLRLNADYTKVDESQLLREYYKKTKPHLNDDEINFVLQDKFSWDSESEDERSVKLKQLAYKEEIASAKNFLQELKDKYYEEIKLNSVSSQNKEALDFVNKYNKEQQIAKQRHDKFTLGTKNYFGEEFKGFDFNVSDKKFRFKINNKESVANSQSNINNFVEKFFNKEGDLVSYNDYHKAIYAAENADTIASHFYEQGKSDALKDMMAKSKNVDNSPRSTSDTDVTIGGFKVKAISGADSSKLRINKK